MKDELLTLREVAAQLHVSYETVAFWVWRARILPSYGLGAGHRKLRRVKKADLEAFVERGFQPAVTPSDGSLRRSRPPAKDARTGR